MRIFFFILMLPLFPKSHPGIGIVKDSRGNIFYTDLHQVWRISNGVKTIAVPDVHTHELYIDKNDNLYGEGGRYDEKTNKFFHYLWVYRAGGKIDTVIGMKEAYVHQDFSLSRDKNGNEYYIKQFLKTPDSNHIFRKSAGEGEKIHATGQFKGVSWLNVQDDGTILYVRKNVIYRVDSSGKIKEIKEGVGNKQPSFKFSGNSITIWGLWADKSRNIYAAVFSDQAIKKIDAKGKQTIVYKSKGKWTPLHGVFDNNNQLWVLEGSDKNEVRVVLTGDTPRYF